ncbi:unnamed protein product, partial [Arctogadus glacialis]
MVGERRVRYPEFNLAPLGPQCWWGGRMGSGPFDLKAQTLTAVIGMSAEVTPKPLTRRCRRHPHEPGRWRYKYRNRNIPGCPRRKKELSNPVPPAHARVVFPINRLFGPSNAFLAITVADRYTLTCMAVQWSCKEHRSHGWPAHGTLQASLPEGACTLYDAGWLRDRP